MSAVTDCKEILHERAHVESQQEPMLSDPKTGQVAPFESAIPADALGRRRIHAEAQLARDAERSRYEISKLAMRLLKQHHREQHLANVDVRQRATAQVDSELSSDAAELISKHTWETTESEEARFVLFEEFDAKREVWAAAVTTERLLVEEGCVHADLVESLKVQKQYEDEAAEEMLESTVKMLRQDGIFAWNEQDQNGYMAAYDQIREAKEQAAVNRRERHRVLAERLDALETDWNSRQLELGNRIRISATDCLARFKLEDEYQARLAELVQAWNLVQQRQAQETSALADKRVAAHATIFSSYDIADKELRDERRRVDEWWDNIIEASATCRRRIDEDEARMLDEVNRTKKAMQVEAEILASRHKAETMRIAVQQKAEMGSNVAVQRVQSAPTTADSDITTDSSNSAARVPAIELKAVDNGNVGHADPHKLSTVAEKILAAPTPYFDAFRSSNVIKIDGGSTKSTYSSSWPPHLEMKSPSASDYETISTTDISVIYPEGEQSHIVWDRSGSPDSLESDYVEILSHI